MSGYKLLDSGNFSKLEQVGDYRFVRPAPAAVWQRKLSSSEWQNYDALFVRSTGGDGEWKIKNTSMPEVFKLQVTGFKFWIRLTPFGHLGIFPEQMSNWEFLRNLISEKKSAQNEYKVLNLFAYTGGASIVAAQAGASVVHLDASKTTIAWARENAELNGLEDHPIRWIMDDVNVFVKREIRRGSQYHGLILDPPSYGRGPKNQVWKIEEHLGPLLKDLKMLMAKDFSFALISSHSQAYTPVALHNLLQEVCGQGHYRFNEMVIESDSGVSLPSGACCLFSQ